MKISNVIFAAAILVALSSSISSFANEVVTTPPSTANQTKSFPKSSSTADLHLEGKNFVQEFDGKGAVKRTIITGDAGDGTDALILADTASTTNIPSDKATTSAPLPNNVQGQAAIDYLGTNFNKSAADNNVTPEKLKEILNDPTMHLDTATGRIFVIDNGTNAVSQESAVVTSTPSNMLKTPPLTNVFKLHSNPGASKVIYIDFNGQLVTKSAWSSTADINAPPYDLSGNPEVFDDNELANIYSIWLRVTEDYLPFDVDITTEEPTADALAKTSSTDNNYGTRVVVTKAGTISCNCGGIAYLGIVDLVNAQQYQPTWVFQQSLANNVKYIAEAISHEAGHTLGLFHDGNNLTGYYQGHGTGATSWASIMGVSYYKNVTQWSAGVYPKANNQQDDLAVMAASGFPARADDYGNDITTAATLPLTLAGSTTTTQAFGMIESNTDKDMFVFNASGKVTLNITPANTGANLDINATLSDAQGKVLASSNPVDLLSSTIDATVAQGTYYLTIAGTGRAAMTGNPGYPIYASLGQYQISGTLAGATVNPALAPIADISVFNPTGTAPFLVNFASGSSVGNGAIKSYAWTFEPSSTSTVANPAYTFTTVGVFPVSLTITNEFGLTSTKVINITVQPAPAKTVLRVKTISLALSATRPLQGIATVTVSDVNGIIMPNVTVSGTWSGYFTGRTTGITNNIGVAKLPSNPLAANTPKSSTATFKITSLVLTPPKTGSGTAATATVISPSDFIYDATKNAFTLKTITK
ncbi:MAG: PKD domain-containing protein [Methylococcaceae bacterium]